MNHFKAFSILFFFLVTIAYSQTATITDLKKEIETYFNNLNNKKFKALTENLHPKIFDMVPKEQMIKSMEEMFDSPEMKIEIVSNDLLSISEPLTKESIAYTLVNYKSKMRMIFLSELDKPEDERTTFLDFMKNTLEGQFGENSVILEPDSTSLIVSNSGNMFAILNPQYKTWKFIGNEPAIAFIADTIIPEEIKNQTFRKLIMKGVLLVNLGSPDSTSTKDVRKYLDEFLMDERVIDIPYWKRFLLIKGIILQTRPKKSAKAYKKIWWKEGSPLVVISERFAKKVSNKLNFPVALGMRYGSMSIKKGLQELKNKGVTEALVVPLYPHYAMSSYETVVEKAKTVKADYFKNMHLEFLPVFYNESDYIKVMANNIKTHLGNYDYDHILFSYHGIPERHIYKSDTTKSHCKIDGSCCETASKAHKTCYRHQCFETTKGIVKALNLKEGTYSNSFQSRLLKDPWLKPYTDFELEKFPGEGKKKLAVITPAFVSDCLETLEEIAMEGKEEFLEAGGTDYKYIPCLNDNDNWVKVMCKWITAWARKTS